MSMMLSLSRSYMQVLQNASLMMNFRLHAGSVFIIFYDFSFHVLLVSISHHVHELILCYDPTLASVDILTLRNAYNCVA